MNVWLVAQDEQYGAVPEDVAIGVEVGEHAEHPTPRHVAALGVEMGVFRRVSATRPEPGRRLAGKAAGAACGETGSRWKPKHSRLASEAKMDGAAQRKRWDPSHWWRWLSHN